MEGIPPTMNDNPLDGRRAPTTRENIALINRSNVFKAMQALRMQCTISEITTQVARMEMPAMAERTVRRAIDALIKSGHVVEVSKRNGAATYILRDAVTTPDTNTKLVPIGTGSQDLLEVEDFIALMVNPERNPLRKATRNELITQEMSDAIRMRLAFVVLCSGEPGFNEAISRYRGGLILIQQELEHVLNILSGFINSPVWYDHYRDTMALRVREMQQSNPQLYKLAKDYVGNLAAKSERAS